MEPAQPKAPCPNCGYSGPAEPPERYCGRCGQDNRRHRLELRGVLSDTVANLVGWDSKLWRTIRGLAVEPAVVVSEYVAGRRQRYVHPARFCLLALAVWLLGTRLLGVDAMDAMGMQVSSTGDPTAAGSPRAEQTAIAIRAFLARNLEVLLYLALPLKAALVSLLFRRSSRNLAENAVLVFFMAGLGYLLSLVATPAIAQGWWWVRPAVLVLVLVWFVRALRGFQACSWWTATWRGVSITFLHVLATFIFFSLIALPWVLVNGL